MKLEQSFEVEAPLERVWEALVDVERVAPCLPGAAVTGRNDDGSYNGTFTIKIGPTTASYTGKLEMQDIDESGHSATMHAQGSDKRGQGGATATIVSRLSAGDAGTRVEVVTDYHITGRLARFGRGGMIEDISERLLREFAGRLQSSLAGGGGAAAAEAAAAASEPTSSPPPTETPAAPPVAPEPPAAEPEASGTPASESAGESEAPVSPSPSPEPDEAGEGPDPEPPSAPAPEGPPAPPEPEPLPPTEAAPPPPPPETAPAAPPPPPPPPPPAPPHEAPAPTATEPASPLDAGSLVGSVLVERVKRNPKPLVAAAGGLVLLRLLRRRH